MPFKFYLADLYERTEIQEPEGFKDVRNIIERDFDTHGMFINYTDGTLKLGFSCESKDLLEAEYIANGIDGYYLFEVEEAEDEFSPFVVIFSAEVDFSTRNYDEDIWSAEVNNSNTFLKVKNRADKKISFNFQQTLDGSLRDRINVNSAIYSLSVKQNSQFIGEALAETTPTVQADANTNETYLVGSIGFGTITSDEIERSKNTTTFLDTSSFYNDADIDSIKKKPVLRLQRKGDLLIEYDFDFDIVITEDQGSGTTSYDANFDIVYNRFVAPGFPTSIFNMRVVNNSAASPNSPTLNLAATGQFPVEIPSDTEVSFVIRIRMQTTGTAQFTANLDITNFDCTITDKRPDLPTVANHYHVHDALNKHLDFITNDSNFLYSELIGDQLRGYSEDGCLSDLYITNGYNIRQITDDNKTPVQSLKDFTDSLKVIGAIGYGIEEIDSATQVGYYDIFWDEITGNTGKFSIDENLTYDFTIGDSIGFYNSETLFGVYEITNISYNAGVNRTTFEIDVSANYQYYNAFVGFSNPRESFTYFDVLITNNSITEERERLRVEEWRHFYGTNELIDLGVVEEYREEPFNEAIYNSTSIGFSKYGNDEDDSSTLQEFQTESEWSLPVVKSENNLKLISNWLGSTILFNEARKALFNRKVTRSQRNDKHIFFNSIVPIETTDTVEFNAGAQTVEFSSKVYENYISYTIFFNVTGADDAGNNGTYQIDNTKTPLHDIENDTYLVYMTGTKPTTSRSNDLINIEVVFVGKSYRKIEADENMSQVTGLEKPNYFMNQRHTIKRFLYRWGAFLNSAMAYLVDEAVQIVRNIFYEVNDNLSTEIDTYDFDADCVESGLIAEKDNINSNELDPIKFLPNLISATIKICDADYQNIVDAHKGKGANPYGYFTIQSPNEKITEGWLLQMRRSPIDRIAELKFIEKPKSFYDLNTSLWVNFDSTNNITLFNVGSGFYTWSQVKTAKNYYSVNISGMRKIEFERVIIDVARCGAYWLYESNNLNDPTQDELAYCYCATATQCNFRVKPSFTNNIGLLGLNEIAEFRKSGNLIECYANGVKIVDVTISKPYLFLAIRSIFGGSSEGGKVKIFTFSE